MDPKIVLVLSPHTDDGELGAGATIAKFIDEGKKVYYIAFSGCEASVPYGLPKDTLRIECIRSTAALGLRRDQVKILDYQVRTLPAYRQEILDSLIKYKELYKPDLVLIPSSHDMHQDHAVIYWEALRAFKKEASIWGYEHPWNNLSFSTDIFVILDFKYIKKKLKALHEYKSQADKSYMNENNILALSCTRGSQLDVANAETFQLIRLIL